MARCKPARALKITVPRHNAQRLGPSLTGAVKTVCNQDNVIIDLPPPVQEQPSSAGPSSVRIESRSSLGGLEYSNASCEGKCFRMELIAHNSESTTRAAMGYWHTAVRMTEPASP